MIQTIPQIKQIHYEEEGSFGLQEAFQIALQMGTPDERVPGLLRRLFPQQQLSFLESADTGVHVCRIGWEGEALTSPPELAQVPHRQGYVLCLESSAATIAAHAPEGVFWGLQTLRQLLESGDTIPAATLIDYPDVDLRCMNFDLRQTYSRPEKLVEYIEEFAKYKINGLLIEYEDKFPFERYKHLRHSSHCLSKEQLEHILEAAASHYIEIIPLQQSFGHLEYVLRQEAYRPLRETETSTGELCPSRPEAYELVTGLLDEMMTMHPGSRFVHLGCDEVYSLCECETCRQSFEGSRDRAFISFVNQLIDFVASRGKTPILWHDMLDKCSEDDLALLDPRAAVMIWIYNGRNIDSEVSGLTEKFRKRGIHVMGAPAVRCFDNQEHQNYPVIHNRIDNLVQWAETSGKLGLDCMVATNWTAAFSLGTPYGVFETTWFPMLFFADLQWNRKADSAGFIDRFLKLFHGVDPAYARNKLGNYIHEDYYMVIRSLLDTVRKQREVAELISVMIDYEYATDKSRAIHKYVYRWELFPGDAAEWQSLLNNYRRNRAGREKARPRMKELLTFFQPEEMADHYVLSRFYLHDEWEKGKYRELGLSMEDSPVLKP
ncbi:family 20 glycosylhydrolase [Paenibacillus silviterrae]|uniref:family 20 glycosylhydrolase n=1 Tax=Paenibacillus silviterrae TaxID=3242194 RepID=UPI0025433FDD|nr:family 20 glycosylhydrolase [Paenibacillus chinjuensis]